MGMVFRCVLSAMALVCGIVAADVRVIEEIVAKVNGDIITRSEIERTRQSLAAELEAQGINGARLEQEVKDREKNALRDQIDQLLLVQRSRDLNVSVDPEVNRRIGEIQVSSKITDPDKFHQWIREQTGMSFEDFKSQMKNQLLTQRVIGQEVGSRISVPESEKRKYYEDHKAEFVREERVFLRQIFISTENKKPDEIAAADKKAKDVLARARKGEKFAELARDHSDDPEAARSFGELPPYKRGEMRKEIEDVVFKEKKGFITDLIRVPNGFLILRVEERHEAGQASYEEVENEVMERLYMPRMQPRVREYLTALRKDAFLEIRDGYIDSGAAPGKDTSWKDPLQLKPETTTKEEVAARRKKRLLWIIPRPGGGGDAKAEPSQETKKAAPEAKAAPPVAPGRATTPPSKGSATTP